MAVVATVAPTAIVVPTDAASGGPPNGSESGWLFLQITVTTGGDRIVSEGRPRSAEPPQRLETSRRHGPVQLGRRPFQLLGAGVALTRLGRELQALRLQSAQLAQDLLVRRVQHVAQLPSPETTSAGAPHAAGSVKTRVPAFPFPGFAFELRMVF